MTTKRLPAVEELYTKHKTEVLQKYASLEDYIIIHDFGGHAFDEVDENNQKTGKIKGQWELKCGISAIKENPFPYILPVDLIHLVYFTINNRLTLKDIIKEFKYTLKTTEIFENEEKNKSIKNLKHFHLFAYKESWEKYKKDFNLV